MTSYPLPTLAAVVSNTGISAPAFADILLSLKAAYQGIYGIDAYLEPDSQDGQMLAVFAQAVYDANQTAVFVYNQFSPKTASGAGLSSIVKINGLRRLVASNSTALCQLIGVPGTPIVNNDGSAALVQDSGGYQWSIPTATVIPAGGSIIVTATCMILGAINAGPQTLTIATPIYQWQSAAFTASAAPGSPVELDYILRNRQSVSTELPAQSIIGGIKGILENLPGVTQLALYENDTGSPDSNGIPANSIAVVIEGGSATAIAQAIELKKPPGTPTFGSTSIVVQDPSGVPVTIKFQMATLEVITVAVTLKALNGYVASTGVAIQNAVAAAINSLGIAGNNGLLSLSALNGAIYSVANATTFNVTALAMSVSPAATMAADLTIPYNVLPTCAASNVTLTVT